MATRTKLKRLSRVWIEHPIYFITTCTAERRPLLNNQATAAILIDEWQHARPNHGWMIGQYMIMPDHVHFFCRPETFAKTLSQFMMRWKEWTSKRIRSSANLDHSIWQDRFFDHLLRSETSYSEKWRYVRQNPFRSGLVTNPNDWPWQGSISRITF